MYYFAQIMLHRPFIPAAHQTRGPNAKPRTFPSLAICTNAARAVAGLVDEYNQHRPNRPLVCGPTPAFTAGVVLLLNVWGIARSNKQATGSVVGNKERATEQDVLDLKDVRRCLDALRMYKDQWPGTAQLSDTLEQLLNIDIEQAVHVQFPYPPPQGPPKSSRGYSPSPFSGPELDADMLNEAVVAGGWSDPVSFGTSANAVPSLAYFERMGSPPVDPEFEAMLRHTPGPDEEEPAQLPIFDLGLNGTVTANGGGDPFAMDVDVDTVAFWSHAPSAFEVSDWDLYLGFLGHLSSTPSSSGPSTVDNASSV
ncbi:Zn(2)-C6 fungal-type domain-containing protein [Mycena chlorophos]|uniref:Zn(2)-C6 fungal-type domain-containing protein n=1 Tax=Mycena chlorophos TaxID=658473 RepID=A0A8H6RZC3_MYCCL|nr:Zn(2)-C6 fungal-type domain-containing protein [Mycena chlorophos]